MPKNVTVRSLQEDDIHFAYEMTVVEQWNDRLEDIKRMYEFEPKGCFIAEVNSKPAGHVFAISYGNLGWIGLLIVKKEHRRMGIARLLMTEAMDYLQSRRVETIKLEAVPKIADLYRELGFKDEYDSLRFKGTASGTQQPVAPSITFIKEEGLTELGAFDAKFFGADRTRVLAKLYHEYPQLCFISRSNTKIDGYVICRKALVGYKLGPWMCDPEKPETARALLVRCLYELETNAPLYIGTPATNPSAVRILKEQGFAQYSHSIRMRFGQPLKAECVEGVFAIGSAMKG